MLYAAVPDSDRVYVINGTDDHIISEIHVDGYPNSIAVNPITDTLYISSPETDRLYGIDGLTHKLLGSVYLGPIPGDLAIDYNEFGGFGTLILVGNMANESISAIDGISYKVLANIPLNGIGVGYAFSIAIDRATNRAYVTNPGWNSISVIDYTTNQDHSFNGKDVQTLPAISIPLGIVVNSDKDKVYVANSGTNKISIIDGLTTFR